MVILNTIQVVIDWAWGLSISGIILLVLGLIAGIVCFGSFLTENDFGDFCLGAFAIVIGVGLCLFLCRHAVPIYETQYQISVIENTLDEDFFNNYEIVAQDGLILTIREIDE
jgi:hypothetical protein